MSNRRNDTRAAAEASGWDRKVLTAEGAAIGCQSLSVRSVPQAAADAASAAECWVAGMSATAAAAPWAQDRAQAVADWGRPAGYDMNKIFIITITNHDIAIEIIGLAYSDNWHRGNQTAYNKESSKKNFFAPS